MTATEPERSYFVLIDDKEKGPYTLEDLRTLLRSGEITESTMYCKLGMEQWYPVGDLVRVIRDQERDRQDRAKWYRARKWFWITPVVVVFWFWLSGVIDAPTGFDACRQARRYVRERLPLTAEFRDDDWSRDLPFSEQADGTVYCHFWVRESGQKEFRHVHVTMKRTLRFYRVEL